MSSTVVTLLVVAKAPVPGRAKTRIAAGLGDHAAAEIAAAALLPWSLRAQVLERLSQTSLRHLGIQIEVQEGLVRLCGTLRDPKLRTHAEWLVFTTAGVQAVCSDWQIDPGRAPSSPH